MRTGRFGRADRLLDSRDFRRVARGGRRAASRHFVVLVTAGSEELRCREPRLGITASRKVGSAVVRNRVKRRVREWFRRSRGALPSSAELLVIARRGAGELSSQELGRELCGCLADLRRAGV